MPFEGKPNDIGFKAFEEKIKGGAQTLETEQTYERMLLVDWIMQFNDMMERGNFPFEKLFSDHDSTHSGGINYHDFVRLNEFVGVAIAKKDLVRVFNIIDKDRSGFINMFEVKEMSKLTWKEEPMQDEKEQWDVEDVDLKGEALMVKE